MSCRWTTSQRVAAKSRTDKYCRQWGGGLSRMAGVKRCPNFSPSPQASAWGREKYPCGGGPSTAPLGCAPFGCAQDKRDRLPSATLGVNRTSRRVWRVYRGNSEITALGKPRLRKRKGVGVVQGQAVALLAGEFDGQFPAQLNVPGARCIPQIGEVVAPGRRCEAARN